MPNDVAIDYESLYETTSNDVNKRGAFGISFENVPLMSIERGVKASGAFEANLTANLSKGDKVATLSKTTWIKCRRRISYWIWRR